MKKNHGLKAIWIKATYAKMTYALFAFVAVIELDAKMTQMRWNTQQNSILYCKLIL